MIEIDNDELTKAELKDLIRTYRGEIEELQDVTLSQNKAPLVEDVEDALSAHMESLGTVPEEGILDEVPVADAPETTETAETETAETGDETENESSGDEGSGEDSSNGSRPGSDLRPLSDFRV